MIVSGMTITAQHFQGRLIVVPCSPSSTAAIVLLPRLARWAVSCQPQIRTLQGLKVNWQLCDLSEDVSYDEITEKSSNDEQCSGRTGWLRDKERSKTGGLTRSSGWISTQALSHLVRIEQARFNLFKMGLKGVINLCRSRGSAENSIWSLLHLFQVLSLICFSCLYSLWLHTNAIKQKSFCRGWVAGIGWLYRGRGGGGGEGAAGVIAADSPRSPPDWHRKSIQRGCLRGACQIDSVNV